MESWSKEMDRQDRNDTLFFIGVISFFLIAFGSLIYFAGFYNTELVWMNATIIEHNVTSTKGGHAVYNTLVRYENGTIQNIESENLYIVPVGSTIQRKIRVNKKD